jgi:peroxiredoxin
MAACGSVTRLYCTLRRPLRQTKLLFLFQDFTFVCPTEIIAFSDRAKEFDAIDCQVGGVVSGCQKQSPRYPNIHIATRPPLSSGYVDVWIPG